jgi:hypothetical protein
LLISRNVTETQVVSLSVSENGILSSNYLPSESAGTSRRMMPITEAFTTSDAEYGLTPEVSINRLILAGIDDWTAYSIVLEAIESGLLQRSEPIS